MLRSRSHSPSRSPVAAAAASPSCFPGASSRAHGRCLLAPVRRLLAPGRRRLLAPGRRLLASSRPDAASSRPARRLITPGRRRLPARCLLAAPRLLTPGRRRLPARRLLAAPGHRESPALLPPTPTTTAARDAAKALSERHTDGSFPEEDYNVDLDDQSGQRVKKRRKKTTMEFQDVDQTTIGCTEL